MHCLPAKTSAQGQKGKGEASIPTRDSTMLKRRENELRATAEKLLQAFRAGNMKAFLGVVHPEYFRMGEGKSYTLTELRKSSRTKDEMYCFLFDAGCIPRFLPNDTPESSFSEVAKRPEARMLSVEIWAGEYMKEPGCRGSVNFAWVDPVDPVHVSTFTFLYVRGQWKAVGFDFPPSALPERKTTP